MKKIKSSDGSLTVEATLILPLFIAGFMLILLLSGVVKTQTTIQYALNQTAKEVSQYYYVINKLGLNTEVDTSDEDEKLGELMEAFSGFQSSGEKAAEDAKTAVDDVKNAVSGDSTTSTDYDSISTWINNNVSTASSDWSDIKSSAVTVKEKLSPYMNDPVSTINCMLALMKSGASTLAISKLLAQPLCEALMPKYITTDTSNIDTVMENMGVVGGFSTSGAGGGGINFDLSTFAYDGKTINVVAVYQYKPQLFGFLNNKTFNIKQTASTAAWGGPTLKEAKSTADDAKDKLEDKKAEEKGDSTGGWKFNATERGTYYVNQVSGEYENCVVKNGSGIDIYAENATGDLPAGSIAAVTSIDVFATTYSTQSGDEYTLNQTAIQNRIKTVISSKLDSVTDGTEITMADGSKKTVSTVGEKYMYVVVPENTPDGEKSKLEQIASDIKTSEGVNVVFLYKDYRKTE